MGPPSGNGGYGRLTGIHPTSSASASMGPPSGNGGYASRVEDGKTTRVRGCFASDWGFVVISRHCMAVIIAITPFVFSTSNTRGVETVVKCHNSKLSKSVMANCSYRIVSPPRVSLGVWRRRCGQEQAQAEV